MLPSTPIDPSSIAIIVPAFNEEGPIGSCLDALDTQGADVDEIIVVDNASTDGTATVVAAWSAAHPHRRLRLVSESRRSVARARDAGIRAALERPVDLVARVDADTLVSPGWATAIRRTFAALPADVAGGSGMIYYHDLPFQGYFDRAKDRADEAAAAALERSEPTESHAVSGANMVLRREQAAWIASLDRDCTGIHEDGDVSLLLRGRGLRLVRVPGMKVRVSGRRFLDGPIRFARYHLATPRTYLRHGRRRDAALSIIELAPFVLMQAVLFLPNRAWDPERRRFDVRRLVNPAVRSASPVDSGPADPAG